MVYSHSVILQKSIIETQYRYIRELQLLEFNSSKANGNVSLFIIFVAFFNIRFVVQLPIGQFTYNNNITILQQLLVCGLNRNVNLTGVPDFI